jgi:hypothetical protein
VAGVVFDVVLQQALLSWTPGGLPQRAHRPVGWLIARESAHKTMLCSITLRIKSTTLSCRHRKTGRDWRDRGLSFRMG